MNAPRETHWLPHAVWTPTILSPSELCLLLPPPFTNHRRGPWETTTALHSRSRCPKAAMAGPLPLQVTQGKVKGEMGACLKYSQVSQDKPDI